LRNGARAFLAQAIEAEVGALLSVHAGLAPTPAFRALRHYVSIAFTSTLPVIS
jgi:hypothetical protein